MKRRRALGTIIRRAREASGLSMGDMARAIGVTVVRVSDVELGRQDATDGEIASIARALEANGAAEAVSF